MVEMFCASARPMKMSEKQRKALAYTILRPTSSQKGASTMGAMAQEMLKVNSPS
jgi:hypothetical protein